MEGDLAHTIDDNAVSELRSDAVLRVREQVCREAISKLWFNLDARLEADASLVWSLAQLRSKLAVLVQRSSAVAGRSRGRCPAGPLYEFNNIFARFYVAARNALSQVAPGAQDVFKCAYEKMLAELNEKGLEKPAESQQVHSLHDLAAAPSLDDILAEISKDEQDSGVTFKFCSMSMTVPRKRADALRAQARSFAAHLGADASVQAEKAERLLGVTVLNYILASSSLYWGFGHDVYERAQSIGAVLECFASPFNHSLPAYCSPCEPLDLIFGSLGSFYHPRVEEFLKRVPMGSVLVANPPYLESEMLACFERVDATVRIGLSAISIYPKWDDCHAVQLFRQRVCNDTAPENGFVVVLEAYAHAYFDYQENQSIPARFASLGFALGKSLSKQELAVLRGVFECLACEHPGPLRKRARNAG